MFIKWIICKVQEQQKAAFSIAQEQWKALSGTEGFIAQAGGWNLKDGKEACIIAFWESKRYLDQFMEALHDEIFFKNEQEKTYELIEVSHFKVHMTMDGKCQSLKDAVRSGQFLSTTDFQAGSEKVIHFESPNTGVWLSEMKGFDGFLHGQLSKAADGKPRHLVATFWDNIENYNSYHLDRSHLDPEKYANEMDANEVTNKLIALESAWQVAG